MATSVLDRASNEKVRPQFANDERPATNDQEETMSFLDSFLDYFKSLKSPEHRLAWAVAIAADALQIAAFPLFVEGVISPADSLLDLVLSFLLLRLLRLHSPLLPPLAAD